MKDLTLTVLKTFLMYLVIGGILQSVIWQVTPLNWSAENIRFFFAYVTFLTFVEIIFWKTKLITKD